MSFFEKNPYSSGFIDKKESISEQQSDSPRRLKVALKYFRSDEKIHNDGHQPTMDTNINNIEATSNDAAAVEETTDGIVPKDDDDRFCFDTEIFRVYCKCAECLQYREVLIQLVLEDHEYNTLWDRLKALIREFYDVVPQNPVPYENSMDAKYEELINSHARWFTDGHIDKQKNIQLSLSSQLPLTNEMTFILVFSMLYTRDPHQLFELLCIQLRCISIAYSDGLKQMLKTNGADESPTYNPVELLTFILDGYDKFCSTAKKLSSLLFELQRDHLQQFLLTWTILNKRMYQRYVYMEIQELIPECILKLKDLLEPDDYSTMAHRLIRFDEDMTSITKNWSDVWSLLQEYHMGEEDSERRNRISCIQDLLKAIRDCEFNFEPYDALMKRENSAKMQWMRMENRDEAWALTVDYLKRVWQEKDDSRLYATVRNERCITCDFALASHYADCDCVTCLIAGGPCSNQAKEVLEKYYCTKCSFYEKLDRDYMDYIKKDIVRQLQGTSEKSTDDEDNDDLDDELTDAMLENHCYHLSWAVFKHLPSRKVYNTTNFDMRHFCSFQEPPCMRNECRVATHIISGLYPLNFSKFLIKAYQPLKEEERKELMNIQKLYFSYLMQKISDDKAQKLDMLQQMDLLWNIDDAEYTLFCDIGSAFAECYLIDVPIPVHELLDSCFILDNHDIELNTYWLECIYMFKESDNSPLKKIENNPKVLEFQLRMQMDQISSMNDVGNKFSAATTKLLAATAAEKCGSSGCGKNERRTDSASNKDEHDSNATSTTTSSSSTTIGSTSATVKHSKILPESYEKLRALLDVVKNEAKLDKKDDETTSITTTTTTTTATTIKKEIVHHQNASGSTITVKSMKKQINAAAKPGENPTSTTTFRETKCKKHDICDKDNATEKDVTLADAVKIAVKQQLNQKLEAELKSLKKEHSVLKDMVRDLEQIKENDESQLITKKEKGSSSNNGGHHCCSEHSDMLENQQNHPKMCHRGDGQCTCYYCTIFGHTECNHGRSTETRDRLRKRLHNQIHSKSSTKTLTTKTIKNQPGALKKMLASKVTPTNNASASSSTTTQGFDIIPPKHPSKPVIEQKDNSTNEILEAALHDNFSKLASGGNVASNSSSSGGGTSTGINASNNGKVAAANSSSTVTANNTINAIDPKNAKKRKILATAGKPDNQHQQPQPHQFDCDSGMCKSCDGKSKNRSENTSVSNSDVDSVTARRSKSAQMLDNDYQLDAILDFIEGNSTNKKDLQKKAAKKAKQKQKKEDVKRIEELEQLRDQFHEAFFKELDVKNDLKNLRSMKKRDKKKIAEFETSIKKYGKFKSKIESNILELIGVLKGNNTDFKFAYLPTKEQQLEKQQQQQSAQDSSPVIAELIGEQVKSQNEKSNNVRIIQNDQRQDPTTNDFPQDQSKRMVTIRRINVPHAEPQVTVTAKGISPDKDKLLYTFINGQLIPSANVATTPPLVTGTVDTTAAKSKLNAKSSESTSNNAKAAKKQAEPVLPDKTAKKNAKEKPIEKNSKSNDKNNVRKTSPENSKPSTVVAKATKSTANTNPLTNLKEKDKQNKQKKGGKKDLDQEVETITNATKELAIADEKPKKEKKKEKKAIKFEYADPNYKVNQFDLLDMDEDDGYYIESSDDDSSDDEPPVSRPSAVIQSAVSVVQPSTNKPNPPLSNQSSVESQSAQANARANNKNQSNAAAPANTAKNAKAAETTKKGKNETNTKTQLQKTDRKSSTDSTATTSTKSLKSQPQNQTYQQPSSSVATIGVGKQANATAEDSILSKKQKKKLEKKQNSSQTQPLPNSNRTASRADSDFNAMSSSMQRMRLNSDSTTEAAKSQSPNKQGSPNVSIMDQLNRGVKVEGLMLPPGITLTRVDPTSAEGLRAKKEAISRISQPAPVQYQQPMEYQRPPPFITGMPMQSNGLIMVDPMQNIMSPNAATIAADNKLMQQSNKKNRKNRKKNKNKTEEENVNDQLNSGQPKIVTLRNPLFQGANDANRAQQTMPLQQRNQVPLNINQPASATIIKNDNGMFTIRNTALLHQAMSNGVAQNYRPYSSEMYQTQPQPQQQPQHDMKVENYSYFSGVANQAPPPQQPVAVPIVPSNGTSASSSSSSSMTSDMLRQTVTAPPPQPSRKAPMAIGSERKGSERVMSNEHKQQPQLYSNMNGDMYNSMHMDAKRSSYSSFDGSANFKGGFNSDFIGAAQSNASIPTTMQNQYYHLNGGFSFNNQNQNDTTASLFGNRTLSSLNNSHCCDDSSPAHAHDPYGHVGAPKHTTEDNSFFKKFDDDSFLHGIHSGQRLNSEVTIHNINDPKFSRKPTPVSLRDGVEITRINGPDGFITNPNLQAFGSQRQSAVNTDDLNNSASSEFGENVFVPNSAVNLNELNEQEREIESFKRFNYYYEPPKNKPKVNLDVKGIVVAKKQPASTNSSPYFGDLAGSSLSNMPRLDDDLYTELNAFKSNNCDQTTINRIHSDNFLHGIIGDGLKTDHN